MASKIEWTGETWNPVTGCTIESAGCRNCYAMRLAHRLASFGQPQYQGLTVASKRGPVWTGKFGRGSLEKPRKLAAPTRIFVNSMSDLYHPDIDDDWRDHIHRVMVDVRRHQYQCLTKRPQVAAAYINAREWAQHHPHIWIGTSVENSDTAWRIDALRSVNAGVRFLSIEPLIGRVGEIDLTGIHWVITGGESGPGARPVEADWVREIRDQCAEAGVPMFHKQWGSWRHHPHVMAGGTIADAKARDLDPDAKGGATLDGRLHRDFPA